MNPEYARLFHQSSKDLSKGHPSIPLDSKKWPAEWTRIDYKTYPRLTKILLPEEKSHADLFDVIQSRKSGRDFARQPVTALEMGTLLRYVCGNMRLSEEGAMLYRSQPSAGARYPLELYALVRYGTEEMKPGLYHYNVKLHALELLWEKMWTDDEMGQYLLGDWVVKAGVIFFLTAVFARTQMKYGERGYRFILLEAGHIGQNLHLVSEALGLKCCALGGTHDENIEALLDIDGVTESLVYTLVVGH